MIHLDEPGFDFDRELTAFRYFETLDQIMTAWFQHKADMTPGLDEFARDQAERFTELTIAQLGAQAVGVKPSLLFTGFLRVGILLTRVDEEDGGRLEPVSGETMGAALTDIIGAHEGDVPKAAHEWSLLAPMMRTLEAANGEHIFNQPDARFAFLYSAVVAEGFSRGILEL